MEIGNSILKGEITKENVKNSFEKALRELKFSDKETENIENLFDYALKNDISDGDFKIFKKINDRKKDNTIEDKLNNYFKKWCSGYVSQIRAKNLNIELKTEGEIDPALSARIKRNNNELTDKDIDKYQKGHFLFMSAENYNGILLEEYLASFLQTLNWLWCAGEIYKATDFIYLGGKKTILLQVKNKYNTENSSSDKIREGTTIIKWYRLKSATKKNPTKPRGNWEQLLQELGDLNIYDSDQMAFLKDQLSEKAYIQYIKDHTY